MVFNIPLNPPLFCPFWEWSDWPKVTQRASVAKHESELEVSQILPPPLPCCNHCTRLALSRQFTQITDHSWSEMQRQLLLCPAGGLLQVKRNHSQSNKAEQIQIGASACKGMFTTVPRVQGALVQHAREKNLLHSLTQVHPQFGYQDSALVRATQKSPKSQKCDWVHPESFLPFLTADAHLGWGLKLSLKGPERRTALCRSWTDKCWISPFCAPSAQPLRVFFCGPNCTDLICLCLSPYVLPFQAKKADEPIWLLWLFICQDTQRQGQGVLLQDLTTWHALL